MLLAFGDVFRFQEKDYVYLARINDVTYAAEIVDHTFSRELHTKRERVALNGRDEKYAKLYCFVMLTTPDFKDRAALVGFSDQNEGFDEWPEQIGTLTNEDLKLLKDEIVDSNGVPLALKELAKS